jgi:hypothetical protein
MGPDPLDEPAFGEDPEKGFLIGRRVDGPIDHQLESESRGDEDQTTDDDEGVFLPAEVDEAHQADDEEGDEGQRDDRKKKVNENRRQPIRKAGFGLDPVHGQHGEDEKRGGQVFVDDDDREFREKDLRRRDRKRNEELQVAGKIEGRKDVIESEDEDEELAHHQGERQKRSLLSERGEQRIHPADALEVVQKEGRQSRQAQQDEGEEPQVPLVGEQMPRTQEGEAEIDPQADAE